MLLSNTQTVAQVLQTSIDKNINFKGVFTDTRAPLKGGLFVALSGANFNGHDYIDQAEKMGAVAILASAKINSHLPVIYVEDTTLALGKIAHFHRQQSQAKVVAITGSNGKTTTKNILKNILTLNAPTLATKGNLNNHLGVPMTLLELHTKHQYAVIEMGANHVGEITYLRNIANPDIAVVTNTLDAHIGEFGGFDNLVHAKGEIYTENSKNIVNTKTLFEGDVSFGKKGDIFASNVLNNRFDLNIFDEKITVTLPLLGQHNIDNALAASACAYALDIDINTIKQGLENTRAEKGRLNLIKKGTRVIIDDSYNANPSSTKYALEVLNNFTGKKIAILGQMAELGNQSKHYHSEVGQFAKSLEIDSIYSYQADYGVQNFNTEAQLLSMLKQHTHATILFKGSRIAKLETIIAKL